MCSKSFSAALVGAGLAVVGAAHGAGVTWPVSAGGNGHSYEIVLVANGIDWATARAEAMARGGHLVTVTSGAENAFLSNDPLLGNGAANGLESLWTGGVQPAGAAEPAGGWAWDNGEAFGYANWWGEFDVNGVFTPFEPNNDGGNEDRIAFQHGTLPDGKAWNDLVGTAILPGYVVEYEVPEPATLALLAVGMAVSMRRRKLG